VEEAEDWGERPAQYREHETSSNVTTSQAYGPFGSTFEAQRRPLTYAITQADPRRTQPSKRFASGLRRVPLKFVQTTHEQLNERYAARG